MLLKDHRLRQQSAECQMRSPRAQLRRPVARGNVPSAESPAPAALEDIFPREHVEMPGLPHFALGFS